MSESTMIVDEEGTKRWKNEAGQRHRIDGPAVETADGTKEWYQNGLLHRLDGPAVELPSGTKFWYKDGKIHRESGPAVEHANGLKEWHLNGLLHREDGPAVEFKDGTVDWYFQDELLGKNIDGFWILWDRLDEDQRQNVNLHIWLRKLTD